MGLHHPFLESGTEPSAITVPYESDVGLGPQCASLFLLPFKGKAPIYHGLDYEHITHISEQSLT